MGGDHLAVLVTGGAGYIGSHLCVELLRAGYETIVVDNFSTSSPEALNRVQKITSGPLRVYHMDLANRVSLMQLFSNESIDAVIHLAGFKSVGESTSSPLKYYANNIAGTITLCEVMESFQVRKLVFSSSATVYAPSPTHTPISENHPLGAINPYGHTKLIIEGMLSELFQSSPGWSISILRYFNPVGAHESGLIGEDPKGVPTNLLPYLAGVAVGNIPTLFVYGNDYPTKDGTGIRDYIHVVDLARGHMEVLKRTMETTGLETYNLGTGKGYSVMEMIQAFERVSGKKIAYQFMPRRKGDLAFCVADVTKAKHQLNWKTAKDIDAICEDTWRWQKANPNGYKTKTTPPQKEEKMV
jgi:UDP-glucose 4-epimerase